MKLNRRAFVVLGCSAAAAAACGGCAGAGIGAGENAPIRLRAVAIDAGPVAAFAAEGVYNQFAARGFFIVRRGTELVALSSLCTHRACRLRAEADHSFYCKCHGSTFDPAGHVTEGPATRDLPVLATTIDERGHLIVRQLA